MVPLHERMLTEIELQAIEEAAVELARESGKLLMGYFRKPLEVSYKSENQRSPVTEADHASDAYLQQEIKRRFPDHGIISEETEEEPGASQNAEVLWVIDPLDGTSNFMNGLPIFGVSIGVLEQGRPVAAAIFLPSITSLEGNVYHAKAGGGSFCDSRRLALENGPLPTNSLLVAMPSFFLRMFKFQDPVRRRIGEIRSTGSIAHDMAQIADGVFQYAVQSRPWIWDVAAGVLLVQEAGGTVMELRQRPKRWQPFESFDNTQNGVMPTAESLRKWREVIIPGNRAASAYIAERLTIRRNLIFRARLRFRAWLERRRQRPEEPPKPSRSAP
jgi:myo-inositol-1(or 4)-monophosphatase